MGPYLNRVWGGYVERARASFDKITTEASDCLGGQELFNTYLAATQDLINEVEPFFTAAAPLTGAVGYLAALAFKVVSFFVNYNYQTIAVFVHAAFRAALFILSKASSTAGFILCITFYPRFLLKFLFFVAMATIMSALGKFFMISMFISFRVYRNWLFLTGLLYIWLYTAKRGYAARDVSESDVPENSHEHILAHVNMYGVALVSLLPLTINLLFGLPTILPM